MKLSSCGELVREALRRLLRREPAEPGDDPYAYVGAPKKPRPPLRDRAVAEPLE